MSVDIEEVTVKILDNISQPQTTYSSGFCDLDTALHGFPKSQMTILAGRHSMGKTAFALTVASNFAKNEQKVLFVSCEMDEEILMKRLISSEVEIDMNKFYQGTLSAAEWKKVTDKLNSDDFSKIKDNLIIEPSFTAKFDELTELINNFASSNPNSIVIIDYFQQLNRKELAKDRYVELADLASSFKRLAVENKIHIILISQISRKVEERIDKRPIISDLSECDALSQHADNIMFIHRDEYWDKENCDNRGMATIIIDKVKNSKPSEFDLLFQSNIMKFKHIIKPNVF